jgi:hypothetical protein
LPTIVERSIAVDTSALPANAHLHSTDGSYRGLTEADCARFAACASTLGNLLDEKARASSQSGRNRLLRAKKTCDQSCVVLRLAADEERSRAVGDALEAFYRLIEAEGRHGFLQLGLKEVNESLARAGELQAKGLPPPVEIAVIRKQLIDLRSDEANLRISILQLNARLKVLLGLSCSNYSLWPLADLKVVPVETDIEQAVEDALRNRPDVALLRTLACCLDADSLAVANQALAGINPLLAETSSSCASLLAYCDDSTLQSTKQQAQTLLADRKRQATEEIRQAVGQVAYRVQLVILAQQKLEIEERRIKELEEKKSKGLDVEGELTTARLNLYEAQGEQLGTVVNWKIARAQLLEAQGRLLEEWQTIDNAPAESTPMQYAPTFEELPGMGNASVGATLTQSAS